MLRTTLLLLAVLTVVLVWLVVATAVVRLTRARAAGAAAGRRAQLRAAVVVALGLRAGDADEATHVLLRAVRRHRDEVVDILTSVATTVGEETRPDVVRLCGRLDLTGPLRRGLHHPEPARRVAAAEIVGLFGGPSGASDLHLAMRDTDVRVRVAAARAYLAVAPAVAARAVLRMMTTETTAAAGELAEVLRQTPTGVPEALLEAWHDGTRTPLLVSLVAERADQSAALAVLTDAAHSPDPALRRAALAGLAHIPTSLTLPTLTDATSDPDPDVRALAASALGVLAGPETLPVLIALLDDRSWTVRQRAAAALATTPDGPALLASLLGQATPFVTTAITTALQRTLTTGGLLSDLTDADPTHAARARRAVRALAARPEMARVLQAALVRHPDPGVRAALEHVVQLGTVGPAVPELPGADAAAGEVGTAVLLAGAPVAPGTGAR